MLSNSCRWRLYVAALGLALVSMVGAAPVLQPQMMAASEIQSPSWAALTPGQRAVLAPLQADWDTMEPARQGKWLEIARRWPALSAQDQQRLQRRMVRWARMTVEERSRARLQFQQTRRIDTEQRRTAWETYQALSPEERHHWAAQGKAPPGPRLAADESALAGRLRPVGPALVQAAPGVSTVSVNQLSSTPGQPRRTAQPGKASIAAHVDRNTLLPKHDGPTGDVSGFSASQ
jgi:hypothetical protein